MSIIIGISGFQGAGKDTVADYLQNIYGFKRISLLQETLKYLKVTDLS